MCWQKLLRIKKMGIDDRIVAKLNAELGGNVDNLSRSKDLVNKFVDQLNCIEKKVNSKQFQYFKLLIL